jgi:hypothetical protein
MGVLRNQDLEGIFMQQEFFHENPLFSLKPSSTIAIGHSTHLLREYPLFFFTIFHLFHCMERRDLN